MPKKKKSARPAESGWLLEVGVIGVDKTLKLMVLLGWSLLEVEQVLRPWCFKGVTYADKSGLPFLKIKPAHWQGKSGVNWGAYEDEADRIGMALDHDKEAKLRKGRAPTSERQPLEKWFLDRSTLKLFRPGPLDNDTERPRLERIKAHSRALGDALEVIAGERRSLPASYPRETERHLAGGLRRKLLEMITYSRGLPRVRGEKLGALIRRTEDDLRVLDEKRKHLVFHLENLKEMKERVGKSNG